MKPREVSLTLTQFPGNEIHVMAHFRLKGVLPTESPQPGFVRTNNRKRKAAERMFEKALAQIELPELPEDLHEN